MIAVWNRNPGIQSIVTVLTELLWYIMHAFHNSFHFSEERDPEVLGCYFQDNFSNIVVMLQVGANAGIVGMTKEHLGLALALSVPVFVVVTKIDMCPPNVLQDTLRLLMRILKSPGCRKVPVMVKSSDDVVISATNFVSER